ncbi:MAG: hypothetical protein MUQ30_03965 [Anaerolineae bacterium]|nr:hypothetical protein [Anaerolineae bacterium]
MTKTSMFTISVTYAEGTKDVFEQTPEADATTFASRINQVLGGTVLQLALEDGLLAIPLANVKSIEITPALPSLPATVVNNVRRVSSG